MVLAVTQVESDTAFLTFTRLDHAAFSRHQNLYRIRLDTMEQGIPVHIKKNNVKSSKCDAISIECLGVKSLSTNVSFETPLPWQVLFPGSFGPFCIRRHVDAIQADRE